MSSLTSAKGIRELQGTLGSEHNGRVGFLVDVFPSPRDGALHETIRGRDLLDAAVRAVEKFDFPVGNITLHKRVDGVNTVFGTVTGWPVKDDGSAMTSRISLQGATSVELTTFTFAGRPDIPYVVAAYDYERQSAKSTARAMHPSVAVGTEGGGISAEVGVFLDVSPRPRGKGSLVSVGRDYFDAAINAIRRFGHFEMGTLFRPIGKIGLGYVPTEGSEMGHCNSHEQFNVTCDACIHTADDKEKLPIRQVAKVTAERRVFAAVSAVPENGLAVTLPVQLNGGAIATEIMHVAVDGQRYTIGKFEYEDQHAVDARAATELRRSAREV